MPGKIRVSRCTERKHQQILARVSRFLMCSDARGFWPHGAQPTEIINNPQWTSNSGPPGGPKINDSQSENSRKHLISFSSCFREKWTLGKSCKMIFRWLGQKNIRSVLKLVFWKMTNGKSWKNTFRASLEDKGLRDRACAIYLENNFNKMVSKSPYDQMAPQLCPFYVPGTLRSFSSFFV